MTLEEKIAHIRSVSMEEARAEGNAIISSYKEALEKVFEDHKREAERQAQTRIKAEATNARLQKNQAMAKAQLDLKREQGKVQQELKDKIFDEVYQLIDEYRKTKAYDTFLTDCIKKALDFAGGEEMTIYIDPSDRKKKAYLEKETGAKLTISAEDFIGGVRSVIRSRNILIDHSFKSSLQNEYDQFMLQGGEGLG